MKFDGTVEELKTHLQTLTDRDAIKALKDGEDRTTATDAIDARLAELDNPGGGDGGDDTIQPPPSDGQGTTTKTMEIPESQRPEDHPDSVLDPDGPKPGDSPVVGAGAEARSAVETPADPPAASSVDYLDHAAPATDAHVMQTRLEKAIGSKLPH